MKFIITSFLFLTVCLCSNLAWSQTFKLTNTNFQEGDKLITYDVTFQYDKSTFYQNNTVFLDSLALFINTHPSLTIEIGKHSDDRGSDLYSTNLSQKRAERIKSYLTEKGASEDRIRTVGYRWSKLLFSSKEIELLKTQKEKEEAHQKNRRVEIIILNYRPKGSFRLSDSTFTIGDKLIDNSLRFEYNKSELIKESTLFLDSLAGFLLRNKNLFIEIRFHKDTRGPQNLSSSITQKRATSIKNYLIKNGIEDFRIIAKGYGDVDPIISDEEIKKLKSLEEVEKAHQRNRRAEIVILKIN